MYRHLNTQRAVRDIQMGLVLSILVPVRMRNVNQHIKHKVLPSEYSYLSQKKLHPARLATQET